MAIRLRALERWKIIRLQRALLQGSRASATRYSFLFVRWVLSVGSSTRGVSRKVVSWRARLLLCGGDV
jgi:hypothetical protein